MRYYRTRVYNDPSESEEDELVFTPEGIALQKELFEAGIDLDRVETWVEVPNLQGTLITLFSGDHLVLDVPFREFNALMES